MSEIGSTSSLPSWPSHKVTSSNRKGKHPSHEDGKDENSKPESHSDESEKNSNPKKRLPNSGMNSHIDEYA